MEYRTDEFRYQWVPPLVGGHPPTPLRHPPFRSIIGPQAPPVSPVSYNFFSGASRGPMLAAVPQAHVFSNAALVGEGRKFRILQKCSKLCTSAVWRILKKCLLCVLFVSCSFGSCANGLYRNLNTSLHTTKSRSFPKYITFFSFLKLNILRTAM